MPALLWKRRRSIGALLAPLHLASVTGCGGAAPAARAPTASGVTEPRPPPPSPSSVWVRFEPETEAQRWSLIGNDEKPLCDLPCARWVAPTDNAFLEFAVPNAINSIRVDVPHDLGPPGSSVVATARPDNKLRRLSTSMLLGGVSLAILGLILFAALDNLGGDSSAIAVSVGAGLGVPMLGVGLYFRLKSHPADVSVRTARASSRVTLSLTSSAPPSLGGINVVFTPLGAIGTF